MSFFRRSWTVEVVKKKDVPLGTKSISISKEAGAEALNEVTNDSLTSGCDINSLNKWPFQTKRWSAWTKTVTHVTTRTIQSSLNRRVTDSDCWFVLLHRADETCPAWWWTLHASNISFNITKSYYCSTFTCSNSHQICFVAISELQKESKHSEAQRRYLQHRRGEKHCHLVFGVVITERNKQQTSTSDIYGATRALQKHKSH